MTDTPDEAVIGFATLNIPRGSKFTDGMIRDILMKNDREVDEERVKFMTDVLDLVSEKVNAYIITEVLECVTGNGELVSMLRGAHDTTSFLVHLLHGVMEYETEHGDAPGLAAILLGVALGQLVEMTDQMLTDLSPMSTGGVDEAADTD